jgi:hypothetical protein
MKLLALPLLIFWAALSFSVPALAQEQPAAEQPPAPAQKQCNRGPVARSFGNTDWLVYSCDDDLTLVIVATAQNPATPFYFTFAPENGHYHLHGEGKGNRDATTAAFSALKSLSKQDIETLLAQTKAAGLQPMPH